jgi:Protein of unknown function (DUF3102)
MARYSTGHPAGRARGNDDHGHRHVGVDRGEADEDPRMTNGRAADENQLANGGARPETTTSKKVMPVDASGDGRNRTLAVIADELRAAIKSDTANIIKKGKLLQEAKEQLPEDGKWLRWLEEQFSMTDRTAQKYMKAADFIAKNELSSLLNLTPNALYLLSEDAHWKKQGRLNYRGQATQAVLQIASRELVNDHRAKEIIGSIIGEAQGEALQAKHEAAGKQLSEGPKGSERAEEIPGVGVVRKPSSRPATPTKTVTVSKSKHTNDNTSPPATTKSANAGNSIAQKATETASVDIPLPMTALMELANVVASRAVVTEKAEAFAGAILGAVSGLRIVTEQLVGVAPPDDLAVIKKFHDQIADICRQFLRELSETRTTMRT